MAGGTSEEESSSFAGRTDVSGPEKSSVGTPPAVSESGDLPPVLSGSDSSEARDNVVSSGSGTSEGATSRSVIAEEEEEEEEGGNLRGDLLEIRDTLREAAREAADLLREVQN